MIRLEDRLIGTLELSKANGYMVKYDLGFPTPRVDAEARTNADGDVDETRWHGPRNVSLTIGLRGSDGCEPALTHRSCAELRDAVMAYMKPNARPVLVIQEPHDDKLRRLVLSPRAGGTPIVHHRFNTTQVQWSAPHGVIESYEPTIVSLVPSGADEPGREYDLEFDRVYPHAAPANVVTLTNYGTADAYWSAVIMGGIVNPRLLWAGPPFAQALTWEEVASFPWLALQAYTWADIMEGLWRAEGLVQVALTANGGLTLSTGQTVQIDSRSGRILFDGNPATSALAYYDFQESTMFRIPGGKFDADGVFQPGVSYIRLDGDTWDEYATAILTYRSAWL